MSTSAKDRLDRILANNARPAKPEPSVSTSVHVANQEDQTTAKTTVPIIPSKCTTTRNEAASIHKSSVPGSSDDDDEYAAMFLKQPEMKSENVKSRSVLGPRSAAHNRDTIVKTSEPVGNVPGGKQSAAKSNDLEAGFDVEANISTFSSYQGTKPRTFCPLSLVAKFPYKYMKDPNDRVSRQFFASNKFYDREWHIYYLHPPQSFDKSVLILVPYAQVQKLVDEISIAFKIEVTVPPFPFKIDFFDDGTPQPSFLGTSSSRQDVTDLTGDIPVPRANHAECPPGASIQLKSLYEAYHTKIQEVLLASKGKTPTSGQKKAGKLFQALQESQNQIKRAQRYFGLRPPTKAIEPVPNLSWQEDKTYKQTQLKSCGLLIEYLDPRYPAKYPFEHQPIIISIDVEAYERNHGFVTEIGISTLDTLDLLNLHPGFLGEEWIKQIRSRHFRIKGREHLVNKDFCAGNPDAFEFGQSEFIQLDSTSDAIDSCFEWPFSVDFKKAGPNSQTSSTITETESDRKGEPTTQKGPKDRNIILLGHDIGADLDYLQKLGSAVFDPLASKDNISKESFSNQRHRILTSLLETLDTAVLYKTFKGEPQPRSLGHVCTELGIDTWFLHNAGNDARYTLEALLTLTIKARLEEDEQQRKRNPNAEGVVEDEWEAAQMRQADQKMEDARQKMRTKFIGKINEDIPIQDMRVQPEEGDGAIDWSLPFRGEKVSRKKKHKNSESCKGNSDREHKEAQETVAADASWMVDYSHKLPKQGW